MWEGEVEEWVDENRTEVFDHEDGAPGDLQAEMFDINCGLMAEAGGLQDDGGGVGDVAAIAALCDTKPVDGDAGLGGERGIELTTWS